LPSKSSSAQPAVPARTFWSGTITFGLVSIPVNLYAAVHARQTAMKMVDQKGRPLGRQYFSDDDDLLTADELVRGYETKSGKVVVITDEELEAAAPEMTRDIELRQFVPIEQIPPTYFERPYVLLPSGKSTKAYNLLAATMERAKKAGIGSFVMRGHQYIAAILADGGVLRAQTLRLADEIRPPSDAALPKRPKTVKAAPKWAKAIASLKRDSIDVDELSDRYAEELHKLAESKHRKGEDVVRLGAATADEDEEGGGKVIDLMKALRESLGKGATVATAAPAVGAVKSNGVRKAPSTSKRRPARAARPRTVRAARPARAARRAR
jgi:DNA end-binding protein Ku